MSRIDKLSITGIRSFSHLGRETIAFNTPLTLIVGYNGSGKTTIIECLKYATTGELPPNSKGGAFIHDPKLCGEREVMAKIWLKYRVPPDTISVVTRSIQLTVKKSTRSQKTLEGTLSQTQNGEKTVTSSKTIVLDTAVPQALGVAPAILDAVIFCHQDESLWPMSEPAALKKRFDEIFEAMKYTKAIENLKLLRKKQGEVLGKLKVEETRDKDNKGKADRVEKRSIALQDEIEELRVRCQEVEAQMEEADRNTKQMREQANSFLNIVNDLDNKNTRLGMRQENLEESRSRMDEMDESDEWLQDTLAQYEERVARYQQDHAEDTSQYDQYRDELASFRQHMSEKLAEQGRHQSDKEKYERQLKSRIELIHQAAQLHSIRGFDGDLDDRKVQAFHDRIQKLLADKKRELDRLQTDNAKDLDSKTAAITELEGQKSQHTQNRVFARQRIGALEKRVSAVQKDLNAVEVDEGAKAILDSTFQDLEQRFQQSSQDFQSADFDTKLQQKNDQLQQLEGENGRLGRELVESTRLLSDRAQLDVRKAELTEKKRKLDTLSNTWSDKMSTMVSSSWEPATIEREFQKALQLKTQAEEEATQSRDGADKQLRQVQYALTNARDKSKKRDAELERCKSNVLKALKDADAPKDATVESLPGEIERIEDDILNLEKDISLFEHLGKYFLDCQKVLNKQNRCELCERPFTGSAEKSKLAAKIKKALGETEKQQALEELAGCETQLGNLKMVRPQSETYTRLLSEKAESDKEIRAAQDKEESIVRQLEELDVAVRDKKEDRQDLESMSKTVLNISQTYKDIEEAETQVDRIMSQQQSSGAVRSTQEINELRDHCTEQMRVVQNEISKLSTEKQRMREKVNALELERSELRNKIGHAVRQLERKKDFQDQIQGYKDDMSKQREIIQQADKDLGAVEPEISKARTIREDVLQRGRAKEKKVADERDGLASSASELKMVDSDIQDYLDRGGPMNLANNEKAIRKLEKDIERLDKDMDDLTKRINKTNENIANSDGKKKNIMENLNYRKAARDIEQLRREIRQLESRNANEDYERLTEESKSYESQRHILNAERGSMMGSMKTKDEELARLLVEWETEYQNAAQKYRETYIKVETTKAAIEDLGRYSTALNNAIMKYHGLKMEEVNRIAGELWQRTYQGTDIDTILIRSDSEVQTGRSSYNYRVCMVKQDTEMDMRGRCSAGQKVLASIIIRLALAESFGIGCGLIALDEPTTNLDRDNIKSLAESLHEIIKARKSQANFQLIVITHDEEFLRHMRCSDFCDTFYRVSRDDRQNSVITQQSISEVV